MTYKDIPGYCDFHSFYKEVFDELPDGANIAEIGVYLGHSMAYMATLAKESGKKITIYAVDTFEGSEEHKISGISFFYDAFCKSIFDLGLRSYVIPVYSPSVCAAGFDYIPDLDFCFIDAAHDYENVKADILAWRMKVKPGGVIAGHDYCSAWPGVMDAVDEIFPDRILTSKSVWYKKLELTS